MQPTDNAILVTVLEVLKKELLNFCEKSIPTEDLVKMADFFYKNNNSEFKYTINPLQLFDEKRQFFNQNNP